MDRARPQVNSHDETGGTVWVVVARTLVHPWMWDNTGDVNTHTHTHTHWERQITAGITETEYFESPYNAVNRYIIILSTCNDIPLPCTVYTHSKTRRFTPHTQWDGGGGACDTRVYMLHSKLCRQNRLWNTQTPTHSDQNNHQNDCLIIGSTALHNTTKWS